MASRHASNIVQNRRHTWRFRLQPHFFALRMTWCVVRGKQHIEICHVLLLFSRYSHFTWKASDKNENVHLHSTFYRASYFCSSGVNTEGSYESNRLCVFQPLPFIIQHRCTCDFILKIRKRYLMLKSLRSSATLERKVLQWINMFYSST